MISDYKVNNTSVTADGFTPLLYYYGPNNSGGAQVGDIPYSDKDNSNGVAGTYCDNSGTYNMVQKGSKIEVTVSGYSTDITHFPSKSYSGNTYWTNIDAILEGIFSTFQLHVVYPYENASGKVLNEIDSSATNANASVTVDNMNATSENGTQATKETYPLDSENTDNKQSETFILSENGTKSQSIIYSSRNKNNINEGYVPGAVRNDEDIAAVGVDDLAFTVTYNQSLVGEANDRTEIPLAVEQLVLFDRDAIELKDGMDINASTRNGYKFTKLYARYKNGRLTSDLMKTVTMDDFEFTDTPSSEGCDGVLVHYAGCYNEKEKSKMTLTTRFACNVKKDYKLANQVYMITALTRTWTSNDLNEEQKNELLTQNGKENLKDIRRSQYESWVNNKTNNGQNINDFINSLGNPKDANIIDKRSQMTVPNYTDGVYDIDTNTHKFGQDIADALYLVPYKVSVQKKVAQHDGSGTRGSYNVSKQQRYVDYVIDSQIKFASEVQANDGDTTTVTYVDTLPKGLTYIGGSSYLGGTYEEQFPDQGKVTGGEVLDPEVESKTDGTTVLTWKVENVLLSKKNLQQIHYSCKIGDDEDISNDVNQGDLLKNSIKIQTTEDKRECTAENDNLASYSITVLKDKELYLSKTGEKLLELKDDNGYFDLNISNTLSSDKNNLFAVDTMPQNGKNGTQMHGNYSIKEITLNKKLLHEDTDDFEIWYTNSKEYAGKKADEIKESVLTTDSANWKKADATTDGDYVKFTGDGLIDAWPTVIVYKDDCLKQNTSAKIHIKYNSDVAAKDDHLVNTLSIEHGSKYLYSDAEVDIVKRSLEGTVWLDKDKDGKIGDTKDEKRFSNVKVILYEKQSDNTYAQAKAYDEFVKNSDGTYTKITHPTTVTTDENGHYKFDGLPEGDFKVVFESGDGIDSKDLSNFDVTQFGTDKDSSKVKEENVVKTNDKLQSGSILDIKMPTKDEMINEGKYSYNLPNQNLGLTVPSITISGTKTWDDKNNHDGLRPDSITLQIKNGDTVVKEIKVKESEQWKWSAELPKYDEQENEIQYTVAEKDVFGYTSEVNGYDITNTHTVTPLTIPVTKVWNDNDNNDKIRPDKVVVHLYADGKDTNKTVELSEDNQWNASFTDLDQYKEGKKIVYTVVEDEVKGYKVGITGSQDTGYVLTNTHGNETVEVKGTKTWDDQKDQDKVRPTKITIRLLADGKEIAVKEVTKETNWTYDFGNLAKYKDGKEIVYTISEDEVEGYKTSINGFNITNSHIPTTPSKPSTDKPSKDDQNPKGDQSSKNEQPTNGQTQVVKGETKTTSKEQTNKIKTGDDTHLILYVLFVVVSFMGILFLKKKAHN